MIMKTKYLNTYKRLFLVMIAAAFLGCESNLDIEQQGVTSSENFYQSDSDALEAIAAVYESWRGSLYTQYFLKNLLSDDIHCGGGARGDNSQFEQLNEYNFTPANTSVSDLFATYYNVIYLSNLVINRVGSDTEIRQRAVAEAHAIRGAVYFDLITLWGEVPYVISELSPEEYQQPNGSLSELWALVEDDLTYAIDSGALPTKGSAEDMAEPARLTVEAAKSFYGKALLFQERYAESATVLKEVINSGNFQLYPTFDDVLREVSDFSSESVFEYNSLNDAANPWTQGNLLWGIMHGWRSDKLNLFGYFGGLHPIYPAGWGFANPTEELYSAFVEMEGPQGVRLQGTIKTYYELLGMYIALNEGSSVYGNEGYFNWKHRYVGYEVIETSYGFTTTANIRVMRYAEVLLMASEACLQSGDTASALQYINEVRSRVELPALGAVTLQDIKKEKRLELCFEGIRYQDLVRWGDTDALSERGHEIPIFSGLNADGSFNVTYPYSNPNYGFQAKHNLLPFPEHEMNVNQNINQNPGW